MKNKELTWVNNCFQDKCDAANGLYGQTIRPSLPSPCQQHPAEGQLNALSDRIHR